MSSRNTVVEKVRKSLAAGADRDEILLDLRDEGGYDFAYATILEAERERVDP